LVAITVPVFDLGMSFRKLKSQIYIQNCTEPWKCIAF